MATEPWTPDIDTTELDTRVEHAFKRVSGTIGFSLSRDRSNTNLLRDAAAQAFESGLATPGPWFLRVGQGALELGGYRPGAGVSPKDVGGEVLREFFAEGNAAYQVVRAALYAGALSHFQAQGVADEHSRPILAAAEEAFTLPDKEAFTQEALPFVSQWIRPHVLALAVGGLTAVALIVLIRAAVPGLLLGLAVAGGVYYFARARQRSRIEELLRRLPKRLYDLMHTGLKANIRRYVEIVNTGLSALPPRD